MRCLYQHHSATIDELDDRTLFVAVGGDVREEDLKPFFEALCGIAAERRPARILVDATYFAATGLRLRWQVLGRLRALRGLVGRAAIYGLSPKLEAVLWIVLALGRWREIRTFLWRHEAEGWVHGHEPAGLPA